MYLHTLSLSVAQRSELVALRDHAPRPYLRERAAALLKIADGLSAFAVARTGLLKPRKPDTVYRWMGSYETGGIAGLVMEPRGHRGRFP